MLQFHNLYVVTVGLNSNSNRISCRLLFVEGLNEDYVRDIVHEYFLSRGGIQILSLRAVKSSDGVLWEREI